MTPKDYSNLKQKTPFDFTDDVAMLEEVLPIIPKNVDRDQYLKDYWEQHPHQLAFAFIDLGELLNDKDLVEEAQKQFDKEIADYFTE